MDFISRADLRANPHKAFLFGDNLLKQGMGGQAGEMRGEPNAIGVPTKRTPSMNGSAFFSDEQYARNVTVIDAALSQVEEYAVVVVPSAGLGTGLAELDTRAPRTFAYLEKRLLDLGK